MTQVFPIQEGQVVYLTPTKNAARNWDGREPEEGTVSKIARKYFYVKRYPNDKLGIRFERGSFETSYTDDCSSGYLLWESKESWYDYREACRELQVLRKFLDQQNHKVFRNERGWEQVVHELYQMLKDTGLIDA